MCGIVAAGGPEGLARVRAALPLVAHRGIRSKIMDSAGGAVGHVRLPIVGLDPQWDQPVRRESSDDCWLIAFVGEILDFRERRPDLQCDLQVVTRGWMMQGSKAFRTRDGFWAVVALSDRGDLHVVCDYLAQKPMYYRADTRMVASEPDALLAAASVTPDRVYLSAVVKWGYCPDLTRTPYAEVKHVLPGEHVVVQANGQVRRRIVDPLEPLPCTPEELRREIEAAVRRRIVASDVPVACLVSGGLDSSVVWTLAARHGEIVPYYARGEEPDREEELAVSAVLGLHADTARVADWQNVDPDEAAATMQEPLDLGSLIPQVALSRLVTERVCLTGDGADEGFGGYERAHRYDSQASDLFHELPAWHLPRLDRVMMRTPTEVRSPFLARRVVQMAMGLPRRLRVDKLILRSIFEGDLPRTVAYRRKKPLRTAAVARDREAVSRAMVEHFWRTKWPDDLAAFAA